MNHSMLIPSLTVLVSPHCGSCEEQGTDAARASFASTQAGPQETKPRYTIGKWSKLLRKRFPWFELSAAEMETSKKRVLPTYVLAGTNPVQLTAVVRDNQALFRSFAADARPVIAELRRRARVGIQKKPNWNEVYAAALRRCKNSPDGPKLARQVADDYFKREYDLALVATHLEAMAGTIQAVARAQSEQERQRAAKRFEGLLITQVGFTLLSQLQNPLTREAIAQRLPVAFAAARHVTYSMLESPK